MDAPENWEECDEVHWMENWDRRRRMAVVQVLCYLVYAIYVYHVHYHSHEEEPPEPSSSGKKRKAIVFEREFKKIREAIQDIAQAIREGNVVMQRGQVHVYTEEEVFAELMKIGVEQHVRHEAYIFLIEDPARVRAFFGYPAEERKDFLIQMMYGPEDP